MLRTSRGRPSKRTWYINSVDVLRGLSPAQVAEWTERWGTRTYAPGERIIDSETTPPELVVVVWRGAVQLLQRHRTGRSETIDVLGPGQLFGVSAAFGPTSFGLDADALTDTVVCALEGRRFLLALASGPEIVLNLVQQLGARVVQVDGSSHAHWPDNQAARDRLAQVLTRMAVSAGEPAGGGGRRLPMCVSRSTLAHQAGCARETIARLLAELESLGAIRRERRNIIVSIDALRRLDEAPRAR